VYTGPTVWITCFAGSRYPLPTNESVTSLPDPSAHGVCQASPACRTPVNTGKPPQQTTMEAYGSATLSEKCQSGKWGRVGRGCTLCDARLSGRAAQPRPGLGRLPALPQ